MLSTGEFSQPGIYCRRRWRRVQHLSNEFWSWWCKEFLLSLQEKQKWSSTRRNFQQEDIVILKDDNCRQNEWKLAKVIKTFPDEKGFVLPVKLLIGIDSRITSWIWQGWMMRFNPQRGSHEARSQDISWISWEEPVAYGLGSHIENHIEILKIKLFVCFCYLRNLRKIFLLF